MSEIPGVFKNDKLARLDEEIQEELQEWNALGMFLEGIAASNESILMMKIQIQTILNLLLKNNVTNEDELNLEFKTLMLATLQDLRDKFTPEAERRRIASITGIDPNDEIEVPQWKLLGPDGQPIKL